MFSGIFLHHERAGKLCIHCLFKKFGERVECWLLLDFIPSYPSLPPSTPDVP